MDDPERPDRNEEPHRSAGNGLYRERPAKRSERGSALEGAPGGSRPARKTSHRGIRVFGLISILVIPVLVLLGMEGALRVAGYGVSMKFAEARRVGDRERVLSNWKYTWKFFDPALARGTSGFSIPATKDPEDYRIFLLGGSAAEGDPAPAYGMARILEIMLRQRYPGARFEVVNAAITGTNSHVVYDAARQCRGLGADLFMIYSGHNEVIGPYGPGTVFTPLLSRLSWIRAHAALRATRVGQLVWNLSRNLPLIGRRGPRTWRGMEMFLERQVAADDHALDVTYRNFEKNLRDVCQLARQSGIPVVLSTLAVNLRDSGPFASLHRPDLTEGERERWEALYQGGIASDGAGDLDAAIEQYLSATEIDDEYADLHFRLGRSYAAAGIFEHARAHFLRARELDTLRFRADRRINEIIRNLARDQAHEGIHFVDAERIMEEQSPHRLPGRETFYDHVHLTFRGNHLVASAFLEELSEILPDRIRQLRVDRPIPSAEECTRRLAFTRWDRSLVAQSVIARFRRAPSSYRSNNGEQVEYLEGEVTQWASDTKEERLQEAAAWYEDALRAPDVDWTLRSRYAYFLYMGAGAFEDAERELRALTRTADHPQIFLGLGIVLNNLQKYDEAVESFRTVLSYNPDSPDVLVSIANTLRVQGRLGEALSHYQHASEIDPTLGDPPLAAAQILAQQGSYTDAVAWFSRALHADAGSASAHLGIAAAYREVGEEVKALEHYEQAIRVDSKNIDAYRRIAALLDDLGRHGEANEYLQRAAQNNPDSPTARLLWADVLNEAGDLDGAIENYESAIRQFEHLRDARPADRGMLSALSAAHYGLGIALSKNRIFSRGAVEYGRSLQYDPGNAKAREALAWIYLEQGRIKIRQQDLATAQRFLEHALEVHPDFPEAHHLLGDVFAGGGQEERAVHHLSEALRLRPDFPMARDLRDRLTNPGDTGRGTTMHVPGGRRR